MCHQTAPSGMWHIPDEAVWWNAELIIVSVCLYVYLSQSGLVFYFVLFYFYFFSFLKAMFFCFGLSSSVVSLQNVCFLLYIYISFFFLIFFFGGGGGWRVWFALASFASFRIVSVSVGHSVCLSVCLLVLVCVCVRVWNFVKWERAYFSLILKELAYDQIKCILQLRKKKKSAWLVALHFCCSMTCKDCSCNRVCRPASWSPAVAFFSVLDILGHVYTSPFMVFQTIFAEWHFRTWFIGSLLNQRQSLIFDWGAVHNSFFPIQNKYGCGWVGRALDGLKKYWKLRPELFSAYHIVNSSSLSRSSGQAYCMNPAKTSCHQYRAGHLRPLMFSYRSRGSLWRSKWLFGRRVEKGPFSKQMRSNRANPAYFQSVNILWHFEASTELTYETGQHFMCTFSFFVTDWMGGGGGGG